MISSNDLKNGMTIIVNDVVHQIIWFHHRKPGKGPAFVKTKLRNLRTGAIAEHTFRAKEPIEQAIVERRQLEYLYRDASGYIFMDPETYDQMPLPEKVIEPLAKFLKENEKISVTMYEGEVIEATLPTTVELKVTEAPPGYKGDTATGGTKPVTLETGAVINAPLFVEEGQIIRVDTRSGEYVTRV